MNSKATIKSHRFLRLFSHPNTLRASDSNKWNASHCS